MANITPFSELYEGNKLIVPSFEDGFATNQAESSYPDLWDSLIGFWAFVLLATNYSTKSLEVVTTQKPNTKIL